MEIDDYEVIPLRDSFGYIEDFGYARDGRGKVLYVFNGDIDYDIIGKIRDYAYRDEDFGCSEYDPSCLYTDMGTLKDSFSLNDIVKLYDGYEYEDEDEDEEENKDKSDVDIFDYFADQYVYEKNVMILFIDIENKKIQYFEPIKIFSFIKKYSSKLQFLIREYDIEDDY